MATAFVETPLDPELPIIDAHLHMWDFPPFPRPAGKNLHGLTEFILDNPRYLFDDFVADAGGGHNVCAAVYIECNTMYRADARVEFRPVGETEFASGLAAMFESGRFGPVRGCAAIVGFADLGIGAGVEAVLDAHIVAGGGRFRGIRQSGAFDEDPDVRGPLKQMNAGLYLESKFQEGFARLAPLGLSFDAWLFEPQLGDLVALARAFPETCIILNHLGTPLGIANYKGRRAERFPSWRNSMTAFAALPNVLVKLGGLGTVFTGFESFGASPGASSARLAEEWRPYIETCIETFGADRCMFESNFPIEKGSCSYTILWNVFKRITAGCSSSERLDLFHDTAVRAYRML